MTSAPNLAKPTSILFTHFGDNWIRGSERCLLDLISHLDKSKFTAILWCNQEMMAQEAEKLGIIVYRNNFPVLLGWVAPRFNFVVFIELIKQALTLIDRHQIKILHANSAAPCQWLNFAARKRHLPLVCQLHSIYQLRDRLSLGLYHVSMAVGVSRYVLNDLQNDQMPTARTCIIANGIDHQTLLAQKKVVLHNTITIEKDSFVMATIGSLIKRKGVDLLITAVAQLIKKGVPAHLIIIGDGPEQHNLQQQINQLGLQHKITLLGEQKNVHGILRGTVNLFVSAAREEAFGLVLAEASLAKLPIVAPATGGIPDVVINGETGLLFETENEEQLVNAIYKLYHDPTLCNAFGKAGYQHILNNFSSANNAQQFQQLYNKMLKFNTTTKPWYKSWSFNLCLINIYKGITKKGSAHGS